MARRQGCQPGMLPFCPRLKPWGAHTLCPPLCIPRVLPVLLGNSKLLRGHPAKPGQSPGALWVLRVKWGLQHPWLQDMEHPKAWLRFELRGRASCLV